MTTALPEAIDTILSGPPTRWAWEDLLYTVAHDPEVAALEDVLLERAAAWPDALRVASRAWKRVVLAGEVPRGWGLVRRLDLSRSSVGPQQLAALVGSGALATITELDLSENPLRDGGVALLAGSQAITGLVSIELGGVGLRETGARALAASPHLSHLERLSLTSGSSQGEENRIGPGGAAAIVTSPHLHRLARLGLGKNRLGPKGAERIAKDCALPALAELSLEWNEIETKGLRAVIRSSRLPRLTSLALSFERQLASEVFEELLASELGDRLTGLSLLAGVPVGDELAAMLARGRGRSLRELTLRWVGLTPEGAQHLAAAELPDLRRIDLRQNDRLGAAGVSEIARATWLPRVEALDLGAMKLGEGAAAPLAAASLERLGSLGLASTGLGEVDARALAASTTLENLVELTLAGNPIGPAGAAAIAGSAGLRSLRSLDLSGCRIGDEGASSMARAEPLPALERLDLTMNRIGAKGWSALAASGFLSRVVELSIRENPLGGAAGRLPALRMLDLRGSHIGADELSRFAAEAEVPALVELRIGRMGANQEPQIGDRGARALAASSRFGNLRRLDLAYSDIGDEGARALATAAALQGLEELNLSLNVIDEAGRALRSSRHLPRLAILDLSHNARQRRSVSLNEALDSLRPEGPEGKGTS